MEGFSRLFDGVEDPRRSNATRHDLYEMLMIALLSMLCGGEGCTDMERFGRAKESFLRGFMTLKHGVPSHDAFSNLFNALELQGLQRVLLRLVRDWAKRLKGDVVVSAAILGFARSCRFRGALERPSAGGGWFSLAMSLVR